MGRASRADAERHRGEIVAAAAQMFRERGLNGVSVPEVMAEVGLTHGGFYRHFASKEALAATACGAAFEQQYALVEALRTEQGDDRSAHAALLESYLSARHRDDPGGGCANAGLACDVARDTPDGPVRGAYAEGITKSLGQLAALCGGDDQLAIVELATMVGALVMARATEGNELSDRILDAVHAHLSSTVPAQ